jgi:hypothetical protein
LLEHVIKTSVIGWEAFTELVNGKSHTSIVLQGLHVVKGQSRWRCYGGSSGILIE